MVNAIVSRATDRPFAEAMRDLVFAPLGLGSMMLASEGWDRVPRMAAAYRAGEPPVRRMDRVPAFLAASGNVVGTAKDAMRAAHGIFATRFLSDAARAQLVRVRWLAEDYALGGRIHTIRGDRWAWETGKVAGYRALVAHRLAGDETIVLFNNRDADQSVLASWAEALAQ
jgi:D-alanyl-D-alanine carboxypeptidase